MIYFRRFKQLFDEGRFNEGLTITVILDLSIWKPCILPVANFHRIFARTKGEIRQISLSLILHSTVVGKQLQASAIKL